MKTINMSWQEFEIAARDIANQIKQSGIKVSNIYGKPKGGIILAIRLVYLLNKPMISKPFFSDEDTLYVDDIVDSGGTLHGISNYIACLYYNPQASFSPHFFHFIKPEDSWIVFPWEHE